MKTKRMRTYRKKFRHVILLGKVVLIWYLVVFSVSYITTSDTTADFTDSQEARGMIYVAGDWKVVDGSAFEFTKQDSNEKRMCEPQNITSTLENNGEEDMRDTSTYDVFFSENGDPETDGEKMELDEDEGTIPALKLGGSQRLTFKATEPGHYKFVAYQLDEEETGVWSEDIIITCEGEQKQDANEPSEQDESSQDNKGQSSDTTDHKDTSDQKGTSDDPDSGSSTDNERNHDSEAHPTTEDDDADSTEATDGDSSENDTTSDAKSDSSSIESSDEADNNTEKGAQKDEEQ